MPRVLFERSALFDGISPTLRHGMSVLVDGNRIVKVDEGAIAVEGAERVDCHGRTLMPGLIDAHVHIYMESLKLLPPEPPATYRAQYAHRFLRHMLACGFTAVRDVAGGDHGMAMALREGLLEGPRFFYGGLSLSQTGGHGDIRPPSRVTDFSACAAERNAFAVIADGTDQCVRCAREELRKGAQHIKIMASGGVLSPADPLERCQYSEPEIRVIVEECRRHGAYVCAHAHPAEAIRRCIELGVRTIEHGTLIDRECADMAAARGSYIVPTMAVIASLREDGPAMGLSAAGLSKIAQIHDRALGGLEIMKRAGAKMGFGTDLPGSAHERQGTEFTLRRQALGAFDILHSATAINAEILQMKDQLGVVKAGALADLLVVEGNPLDDIGLLASNGKDLSWIMLDGQFVKRPAAVTFTQGGAP